jgi:DNA-binding transcriptional MerR regulator
MQAHYSIQEASEQTGLSAHTLRYYERIGLIHPVARASSGHRVYSDDDIGWIEFLKKLRSTGMPIRQMQRYAELQSQGEHTVHERLALLRAHHEKVEADLAELLEYRAVIEHKIAHYQQVADQLEREAIT